MNRVSSVTKETKPFGRFVLSSRIILVAFLLAFTLPVVRAETNLPAAKIDDTNSLETLRTYLQLQEQIHATQLAIEENRKQANEASARNAESLANRLQAIEQSLATQRAQDLETVQSSNRLILLVAGTIAVLGFLAMLLMAFSHWRAMSRLAEIARNLATGPGLPAPSNLPALGPGEPRVLALGPPDQGDGRLLDAIDRLEKRLQELENGSNKALNAGPAGRTEFTTEPGASDGNNGSKGPDTGLDRIAGLLGKGQSLLGSDKPEEAIECFDQVLAVDPNHAEAMVKKGSAFERLRKWDDALQWYDRAITADPAITIAYLYKGGIFNRLERFTEALECYEKALHTAQVRLKSQSD